MGLENKYKFSYLHPFLDCKLCKYARRCIDACKWNLCSEFSKKYDSEKEYNNDNDDSMWEK